MLMLVFSNTSMTSIFRSKLHKASELKLQIPMFDFLMIITVQVSL